MGRRPGRWIVSEHNVQLLKLMRFWLFGTFVIVVAALTAYIGLFTGQDWLTALEAGFPIWGITAVLCIGWDVGYSLWLRRKPGQGGKLASLRRAIGRRS